AVRLYAAQGRVSCARLAGAGHRKSVGKVSCAIVETAHLGFLRRCEPDQVRWVGEMPLSPEIRTPQRDCVPNLWDESRPCKALRPGSRLEIAAFPLPIRARNGAGGTAMKRNAQRRRKVKTPPAHADMPGDDVEL